MPDKNPIPVAVVGVGYLGRFHAQKYHALPNAELVAVVDVDGRRASEVGAELAVPHYTDFAEVLPRVKAVSVAVPTPHHREVVGACLDAGKAVLVEKPIAATAQEARELADLAESRGLILQVGYLQRFNPAFQVAARRISNPQFIESLRIAGFKGRGADVDVVLDLMSHDLDLVLSLVPSKVRELHAVGLSVMTPHTDLANARLIFENGCVANLTASRISAKSERTMRIFQSDSYCSLDFAVPSVRIFTGHADTPESAAGTFREEDVSLEPSDELLAEIEAFLETVGGGAPPLVGGRQGVATMELAERIIGDINRNLLP